MATTNPAIEPKPLPSLRELVFVPAVITLLVTLLRLTGELKHWSPTWFSAAPGGGGAIVGIVWLVPIFGVYFALRLARVGHGPKRAGRAIAWAALGFAILAGGFFLFQLVLKDLKGIVVMWALAALGAGLQLTSWRALFKTLAAYGYAARIPVAVVMYVATRAEWESHYTALAMPTSQLSALTQYFLFGFFPQLVWWVAFTVVVGSLFGAIAAALAGRRQAVLDTRPPPP